jgi:predicted nucleotidyltransferase
MGSKVRIEIPQERVAEFCRRHHIRRLSFFGSVISDHFTQDSDIDVLVDFEQGQVVGLLRLAGMEIELSEILGRKVDLRTPADLSHYFRDDVLSTAEVQYAEG